MSGFFDKLGASQQKSEDQPFVGRICYEFNFDLDSEFNDTMCTHCRKFMTLDCEHIDEFIDGDVG